MIELKQEQAARVKELYRNTSETLILSYIQGHHGRGWVDRGESPRCAQVVVGDFCFFAGNAALPDAGELAANRTGDWTIAVPLGNGWGDVICAVYGKNCARFTRYQFRKDGHFDMHHLRRLARGISPGYRIVPIDEALYERLWEYELTRDYVSNYRSGADYLARGIGFCAVTDSGEIAGGASSYTVFDGGIEIEISTMPRHRRKGVAAACAATLILQCIERMLYPSWDAANLESRALAEKLGYHFDYDYDAYRIEG